MLYKPLTILIMTFIIRPAALASTTGFLVTWKGTTEDTCPNTVVIGNEQLRCTGCSQEQIEINDLVF